MTIKISKISVLVSFFIGFLFSFIFSLDFVVNLLNFFVSSYFPFVLSLIAICYILVHFNKPANLNGSVSKIFLGIFATVLQTIITLFVGLINLILEISSSELNLDSFFQVKDDGFSRLGELFLLFSVYILVIFVLSPIFILFFSHRKASSVDINLSSKSSSSNIQPKNNADSIYSISDQDNNK